jgi:hypothetical protein
VKMPEPQEIEYSEKHLLDAIRRLREATDVMVAANREFDRAKEELTKALTHEDFKGFLREAE